MNFEQAKAELEAEGYKPGRIRRMKCHVADNGVWPVWEDGQDTPAATDGNGDFVNDARIVRYKLDEGNLNNEKREFWIPCVMDGYQEYRENFCAPHWVVNPDEQKAFCDKYYRETTWPNHGEESDDPARWVNRERSTFKAFVEPPHGTPEKERERLGKKLKEDSEIGLTYLCKAIELALSFAPEHQRVTCEKLIGNSAVSPYVEKKLLRIIELAFRAGQVSERSSTYYRGITYLAQEAEPILEGQKTKKQKVKRKKLSRLDGTLVDFMEKNPKCAIQTILEDLIEHGLVERNDELIEKHGGITKCRKNRIRTHRFKGGKWITVEGVRKKLRDLKNRYLA